MSEARQINSLSDRTKGEFRRFSDEIMAQAAKGRMTLGLLKNISSRLMEFTGCGIIEIAYEEREKIFHCDSRRDEKPSFFCDTIKAGPSLEEALKSTLKLPIDMSLFGGSFPDTYAPDNIFRFARVVGDKAQGKFGPVLQLAIPLGNRIRGLVLLAFTTEQRLDEGDLELLEDLSRSLGLALSHNQSQFELRERVKELTCMYNIANLAAQSARNIDKLLDNIVALLPPAWLYPEITEACITLDGKRHFTPGYIQTEFCQSADIVVHDVLVGKVEVVYLESRPKLEEGAFLAEERHLIDSVAREVALIIERRRAEKEQARLHEQLQHADRLATIGQLAAGVAHELNEPLTGILGFAELLKDLDRMPEQAMKDIARIESASLHAREVVRKLLLFARQIPTRSGKVDVNRVIRDVISFFEARLAKDSIAVKTELSPELPTITADQAQMRQIIVNLFVNAAQAMTNGGTLAIRTGSENKTIRIEIADSGQGMTPEVKEKAFLPFFTTKDVNQGTGLGLSVVHGIIKSHHGQIDVQSEPGAGSMFTIRLPIEQPNDE